MPAAMEADEYLKMAAVEDRMWYYRALHGHVRRELEKALAKAGDATSSSPSEANATGASRPHDLLDAGCGTGGLIRRLARERPEWKWTGVDFSRIACGIARERVGAGAEIVEASVTALPFGDGAFDAVVSADVLYHVDDDAAALREFFRVLRPGGVVVLNLPAYRWLWSYHDVAVHSRRRYDRGEVRAKLRAAGFGAVRATYWNTLPFPLVVVRRKLLPPPRDGSDVHLFPAPVEAMFNGAMALERGWLRAVGRLPFGSSVLAVARKE
ncbi:MAG TPA: class I SAM-dependent methyltransferase [Opitutaceae bacterium]|nr:class I SAM-dependent methyltransferase [Opitutaceae bacterium]